MQKVGATIAHRYQVSLKGGHHNVQGTPNDYKNFSRHIRMFIGDRDAKLVVEKLQARADHVPDFAFEYNIVNGELRSIFWADEISKINYKVFGDVVAFDATYHTNRYDMIFVPFTGVDNHKKCVTFGAGLLYSETIESYCWLLECFVKAHGKQPSLVLTDQDPAMRQAVEMVFHESRHRLCMWHIMKKLPSKISGELLQNTDIRATIHKLVWSVYNQPTTFERKWHEMIDTFGLHDNAWLSDMYGLRQLWVPSYFRDLPMCCLMKTTSRCESSNALFKVNSSPGNTLVQFLLCFDTTIDHQRYLQRIAQFKTNNSTPGLLTGSNIEKHAALVYTLAVFKGVSKEIHKGGLLCFIMNVEDVDGVKVYTVAERTKQDALINNFQVKVAIETQTFTCSCMNFTRIGYLCHHVFCVLRPFKFEKIPEHYIMNRWRRDALPDNVFTVEKRYGVDSSEQSKIRIEVRDIVDECLDSFWNNPQGLLVFAGRVRALKAELCKDASQDPPIMPTLNQVISSLVGEGDSLDVECSNPQGIRNKGTRKTKRTIGPSEEAVVKAKKAPRQCKTCGEYVTDHDSRNCPLTKGATSRRN